MSLYRDLCKATVGGLCPFIRGLCKATVGRGVMSLYKGPFFAVARGYSRK